MSDIQGALKELILPASEKPAPWTQHGGQNRPTNQAHLRKVRPRHKMIVSMHMAGFKDVEIARELGYTPTRVAMILRSQNPELLAERERLENVVAKNAGDLVLRFRAESSKSLDTLIEIRDDRESPRSERRQSALAILDRAGYSPVRKNINLDSAVPFEELKQIVGQIEQANEVLEKRDQWVIKDLPTGTGG